MPKMEAIAAYVSTVQATQEQALGTLWDTAQSEAGAPVDTTPISQDQYDQVKAALTAAQDQIALVTSDDAADKAAVKEAQDKLAAIEAIIHGVQAAPAAPEAPQGE